MKQFLINFELSGNFQNLWLLYLKPDECPSAQIRMKRLNEDFENLSLSKKTKTSFVDDLAMEVDSMEIDDEVETPKWEVDRYSASQYTEDIMMDTDAIQNTLRIFPALIKKDVLKVDQSPLTQFKLNPEHAALVLYRPIYTKPEQEPPKVNREIMI